MEPRDHKEHEDRERSQCSAGRRLRERLSQKLVTHTPIPPHIIRWGYASLPLCVLTVALVMGWVAAVIFIVILAIVFFLVAIFR